MVKMIKCLRRHALLRDLLYFSQTSTGINHGLFYFGDGLHRDLSKRRGTTHLTTASHSRRLEFLSSDAAEKLKTAKRFF
jgi:hypothetical protein